MTDWDTPPHFKPDPENNDGELQDFMLNHAQDLVVKNEFLSVPENVQLSQSFTSQPEFNPQSNARKNSRRVSVSGGTNVERKRRDNINERIQDLLKIIPEIFFDESNEKSTGTKDGKPNKGQILTKAIEYVQWLQNEVDSKNRKEVELSIKMRNLEISNNVPHDKRLNLSHTSAEYGLGALGVGPLAQKK